MTSLSPYIQWRTLWTDQISVTLPSANVALMRLVELGRALEKENCLQKLHATLLAFDQCLTTDHELSTATAAYLSATAQAALHARSSEAVHNGHAPAPRKVGREVPLAGKSSTCCFGLFRNRRSSDAPSPAIAVASSAKSLPTSESTDAAGAFQTTFGDLLRHVCAGAAAVAAAAALSLPCALSSDVSVPVKSLIAALDSGSIKKPPLAACPVLPTIARAISGDNSVDNSSVLADVCEAAMGAWTAPPLQQCSAILRLQACLNDCRNVRPDGAGSDLCNLVDRRRVVRMCQLIQSAACAAAAASCNYPSGIQSDPASIPTVLSRACHSPILSLTVHGLLSAAWKGDKAAFPPGGGVGLGTLWGVLACLSLVPSREECYSSSSIPAEHLAHAIRLLDGRALPLVLTPVLRAAMDAMRGRNGAPATSSRARCTVDRLSPLAGLMHGNVGAGWWPRLGEGDRGDWTMKDPGQIPRAGTGCILNPAFLQQSISAVQEQAEGVPVLDAGAGSGSLGSDAGTPFATPSKVHMAMRDTASQEPASTLIHNSPVEDGEGAGPRKEFMHLCALAAADTLLSWKREAGAHVVDEKAGSAALPTLCALGWLLACGSLLNFVHIPPSIVKLSPALLAQVLAKDGRTTPTFNQLMELDEAYAGTMQAVQDMTVPAICGLLEADGLLAVSATRPGHVLLIPADVDSKDTVPVHVAGATLSAIKEAYIQRILLQRVCGRSDAHPSKFFGEAIEGLRVGFAWALGPLGMQCLTDLGLSPLSLSLCIAGSNDARWDASAPGVDGSADGVGVQFRSLFRVVCDPELIGCAPLQDALWSVLDGWPLARQRTFLAFVTGTPSLPAPQTETLRVCLPYTPFTRAEKAALLHRLPLAHTCSNTLEMPNYYTALKAAYPSRMDLPPALCMESAGMDDTSVYSCACALVLRERLVVAIDGSLSAGYTLDAPAGEGTRSSGSGGQDERAPVARKLGYAHVLPQPKPRPLEAGSKGAEVDSDDSDDAFMRGTAVRAW